MEELESLRREAIRALTDAVGDDRLTLDQFEERVGLVMQAHNGATIDAITADLLPTGPYPASHLMTRTMAIPRGLGPVAPADLLRITSVLSSSKRAGSWTVPHRLEIKIMMGEVTIDLRDAVFCSDVLDIELNMLFGSLTLIVPAGVQVENECEERFASTTHSTRSTRSTRGTGSLGLLLRLTGQVRWSSVEIKEKRRTGEEAPAKGLKRLFAGRNDADD